MGSGEWRVGNSVAADVSSAGSVRVCGWDLETCSADVSSAVPRISQSARSGAAPFLFSASLRLISGLPLLFTAETPGHGRRKVNHRSTQVNADWGTRRGVPGFCIRKLYLRSWSFICGYTNSSRSAERSVAQTSRLPCRGFPNPLVESGMGTFGLASKKRTQKLVGFCFSWCGFRSQWESSNPKRCGGALGYRRFRCS